MKNKRTLIILIVLCVFMFTQATVIFFASAGQSKYKFSYNLQNEYVLGTELNLPNCEVEINDTYYIMERTVNYPDGRTSSYNSVVLDIIGNYTVNFSLEKDGTFYQKQVGFEVVINDFADLFTAGDGVTITSDVDVGSWADYNVNGVNVQVVRTGEITYNQVINLAELTKYGYFIEYIANVQMDGQVEIDNIVFTLTDIYDDSNYITIKSTNASHYYSASRHQDITASTCGNYDPIGYNVNNEKVYSVGTEVYSSLYGSIGGQRKTNMARLSYVPEQKQVWARAFPEHSPLLCMDFDDENFVDKDNIWGGFTADLVRLTIKIENFRGSPMSNLLITSIGGNQLSGKGTVYPNDVTFDIDTLGYPEDKLPNAVVNKSYPVFTCYAYDNFGSKINDVSAIVYDENGTICNIKDQAFTPTKAGNYFIKYQAETANLFENRIININVVEDYDNITCIFDENKQVTAQCGQRIIVSKANYYGGIGNVTAQVKVLFDNKELELKSSRDYDYIVAKSVGNYTVVYSLTDWSGISQEFSYNVECVSDGAPVMTKPYISPSNILGEKVVLPHVDAISPVNGQSTYVPVKVYFDDKEITDTMSYVPETPGKHTVKYIAVNPFDSSSVTEYSFDVQVNGIASRQDNGEYAFVSGPNGQVTPCYDYIDSFLALDGFRSNFEKNEDVSKSNYQLIADGSKETAEMIFGKAIDHKYLNLSFATIKSYPNFSSFVITMTDSKNSSEQVAIEIKKENINGVLTTAVFNNGNYCGTLETDLWGANENLIFDIAYNHKTKGIVDGNTARQLVELTHTVDGDEFNGFSSGFAFVSLKCKGIKAETRIKISKISLQTIMGRFTDRIAPAISYSDDFVLNSTYYVNDVYTIVPENCYDVCGKATLSIKLTDPDGIAVYNGVYQENVQVVLEKAGTYSLTYSAKDEKNNISTLTSSIRVLSFEAPNISVDGSISKVKINEQTILPNATCDKEDSLYVYITMPKGKRVAILKNEEGKYVYTFEYKGVYNINYVAIDASLNYIVYQMEVTVE